MLEYYVFSPLVYATFSSYRRCYCVYDSNIETTHIILLYIVVVCSRRDYESSRGTNYPFVYRKYNARLRLENPVEKRRQKTGREEKLVYVVTRGCRLASGTLVGHCVVSSCIQ